MKRYPRGTWMRLQSPDTLRALMAQRSFSMERLARYSGCSKSFVSHLTSGRKSTCTPELAGRIAEALEVPLEILFVPHVSMNGSNSVGGIRKAV
jgi:transcriptional regulator with XRE-family HTH domain